MARALCVANARRPAAPATATATWCGLIFKDVSKQVTDRQVRLQQNKRRPVSKASTVLSFMLPAMPSTDLQTASVAFFFSHYLRDDDPDCMLVSRGHLDCLVPMYSSAKPASVLSRAFAVMAGWAMCLHLGPQRLRASLVALELSATRAVKQAIEDPEQCKRDELLQAVLCLDFADHLASKALCRPASGAHTDGALALVHHRGADSFTAKSSQSLLAATTSNILQSALWFQDIADREAVIMLPEVDPSLCSPTIAIQQLILQILKLTRVLLRPPRDFSTLDKNQWHLATLVRARELCDQVSAWPSRAPQSWGLSALPTTPNQDVTPFRSLKNAYFTGQWHCCYLTALRIKYLAIIRTLRLNMAVLDDAQNLITEAEHVATAFASLFLPRFHATAALHAPDPNPFSTPLERELSARLPLGAGKSVAFRGGVADAQHYLFNLLEWVLLVLANEPDNYSGFVIATPAVEYLRGEHAKVSAELHVAGRRPGLFS